MSVRMFELHYTTNVSNRIVQSIRTYQKKRGDKGYGIRKNNTVVGHGTLAAQMYCSEPVFQFPATAVELLKIVVA
jgi:hypothetical protein